MVNMKKINLLCVGISLATTLMHAESTLYGFGIEEKKPASQTSSGASLATLSEMRQKIVQQEERIDGLTTIVEGLSASLHELQSQKEPQSTKQNSDALLQKLAGMIDKINADYVTKEALNEALKGKTSTLKASSKESSSETVASKAPIKKSESLTDKTTATLYSEGVRAFAKHHYEEAKKRFTITDTKGYKAAASNYYLGEIAYYTKKYEDAIFYYKKSAGLYDKANYIDTLLLHTAISLDKTGEKEQARIFYENIIANYPNKKTAKIAKDRVKKL